MKIQVIDLREVERNETMIAAWKEGFEAAAAITNKAFESIKIK